MNNNKLKIESAKPLAMALDAAELSLQHMHAELQRIDIHIRREVLRFQSAGQDPSDTFRGLFVSDEKANALLAKPFATSWGQTATLAPELAQNLADALAKAKRNSEAIVAMAAQQQQTLRLSHLAGVFGLTAFDVDTLLVALAPALDLRYERLYGYLQDDVTRKRPSVSLALDLLGEAGPGRLAMLARFADDAPLFQNHLLEKIGEPNASNVPLMSQTLYPDDVVVSWLLGHYHPHSSLGAYASIEWPQVGDIDQVLAGSVNEELERAARARPLMVLFGADLSAQRAAARVLAAKISRPLLSVDLGSAGQPDVNALNILRLALRDARMTGALPLIVGWDACLVDGSPPAAILSELCRFPELAVISSVSAWHARGLERERNLFWLEFPVPEYPKRRELWSYFLNGSNVLAENEMTGLAGQFLLTADQIRDAVASAKDSSAQRGTTIEASDIFAAARSHSSPGLSGQARKITPRYTWSDIVLPADQLTILREIVATVHGRPVVLEEWGLGSKLTASDGITVLFAGPPGTGKTMAAEVVASELRLDLYKIELSAIVSKYIGETEKNLERIFKEAESSNAILFFDEADAIFGKRSEVKDAHDRYANIEVSYLLQRMEAYDGVTILATNLRSNLDDAFTRRLNFALDFPFPDETYRLRIWQTLLPPNMPRADDLDLPLLARRFRLAGGNIRNIIVSAAFLAASNGGVVTMDHLMHSTRRELQKMGRLVKDSDLIVR